MRHKKRIAMTIGAAILLAGSTAVAYAYFTGIGTGTGSATVGSASDWDVSGVSTSGGPLLPGSGSATVSYTITNTSNGQQQLTRVTVTVTDDGNGNVLDTSNNNTAVPGCSANWFTVDNTGAPTTPTNLAGGGSVNGSAIVRLTDSGSNQDPCQNVVPQLTIRAS